MPKARMFVVNKDTLISTKSDNIASIYVPDLDKTMWLKTLSDMMADMLQIEIGDYIYLWETGDGTQKSRIHGIYRAISKPFYQCSTSNDHFPLKIHIEKAYDFEEPIDEYDVLNSPYIKTSLWTLIGKKVAGKSRGTSPLSLDESKYLINLLIGKNPDYKFNKFNSANIVTVGNPLAINYSLHGKKPSKPSNLSSINPNNINFFKPRYGLFYEKTLETIFNQELTAKNRDFFNQLGIDVSKVIWYSNYLPYSLEQSEMDYAIISSDDGINPSLINVLEFMIETIDEDHIHRAIMYSKWVNDTLLLGESITEPILICKESFDFINGETKLDRVKLLSQLNETIISFEKQYNVKQLKIFTYSFSGGVPKFVRKR